MAPAAQRYPTAEPFLPTKRDLASLAAAVQSCRGCPLWEPATQAVFGEGPRTASIVLVGEEPGDVEDRRGAVFVGPAGGVLDRALERAGIDRGHVYLTNAVKHFKFRVQGKRRLHQKPTVAETMACLPWLRAELEAIRPDVVVSLGATALRALLGPSVTLASTRGTAVERESEPPVVVTVHPSSVLRQQDAAGREAQFDELVAALELARSLAAPATRRKIV